MFETNFTTIDWVLIFTYLIGIALVGVYVNRHVHDADDYLVGGRGAGTALSVASFIGTGLGLVTVVYATVEGFNMGFSYLAIACFDLLGAFVFGISGVVIARLRRMELTTITEFYERRFNRNVRITAGTICAMAGILNMGLFPKMGAMFLTYVAGLGNQDPAVSEMTVNIITTILILLVLVYTVAGGMIAIIVTDYLQFVLLSLGLGLGLLLCLRAPSISWDQMVGTLVNLKGEPAFNPFHANSYGWVFLIWQMLVVCTAVLCWAPEASRALVTEDVATTKRTFYIGSTGFFARLALPVLWGVAAFCYVNNTPALKEYFSPENVAANDGALKAVPLMMGQLLPTGLLGIVMAGLMAAHMSVHDSYLLAWATIISQDVIAPLRHKRPMTDKQNIRVTQVCVILIAAFLLIWGVWYPLPKSVWEYMSITGTVYLSGATTAMVGGMYWKRASSTGALLSLGGGLFALLGLTPVRDGVVRIVSGVSDPAALATEIEKVAHWFNAQTVGLAVYIVCLILFVLGSLLFPDKNVSEVEMVHRMGASE